MTNAPAQSGSGIAARAAASAAPPYLRALNPEQRAAVETLDGPLLVLAGAGTGKTRVLTTRLAHILAQRKAWPGEILAVTFTNKAAREMKERIGGLIGGMVEGMAWLGTFHSIGVKILRRHAELVGLKSDFSILDTDDQIRLLKQLIQAEGIDEKRWPARQLAAHIDGWKNRGLTPDKVPAGEGAAYGNGLGADLYRQYQERLKVLNAVDFGDLLLETLRLFQEQRRRAGRVPEEVQVHAGGRVSGHQRGAISVAAPARPGPPQHLLRRRRRPVDLWLARGRGRQHPALREGLPRRRRCPAGAQLPLHAAHPWCASGLITHNEGRLGKTLRTDQNDGEKVKVRGHWDGDEEARAIGEDIEQAQRAGTSLEEVAILVRASFQMRAFEDRFITLGLPYRVVGGPRFYERAEIRDALAYLKVTMSPDNDLALERIINVPKRGIGDGSVQKVRAVARAAGISLYRAAQDIVTTEELPAKARKSLTDLLSQFDRWRNQVATLPHTEVAEIILDESGYTEMHQQDKDPKAPSRLENLKELVRSMNEFETMEGFLEHIALVMDVEQAGEYEPKASIMTLHAAKGLEFDTVFLPGWEEGLFPHQRSLDESGKAGLEEERRLAYVGITRARKHCTISFAHNRRVHAMWQTALPSRFIDELPAEHVDVDTMSSSYGGYGVGGADSFGGSRFDEVKPFNSGYDTPGWKRAQARHAEGSAYRSTPHIIEGTLTASDAGTASYATGDRVHHQKFGPGTVTHVDGNKLSISFDQAGDKRVLDSFVSRA
jgi:DNA helicase-2/ATP-dependent DNA helicase PcrA